MFPISSFRHLTERFIGWSLPLWWWLVWSVHHSPAWMTASYCFGSWVMTLPTLSFSLNLSVFSSSASPMVMELLWVCWWECCWSCWVGTHCFWYLQLFISQDAPWMMAFMSNMLQLKALACWLPSLPYCFSPTWLPCFSTKNCFLRDGMC